MTGARQPDDATPTGPSRHRLRAGTGLGDVERLDVRELANTLSREFASVTRALDPAEGQLRRRRHNRVGEHHARLHAGDRLVDLTLIGGPDRPAQSPRSRVSQFDRFIKVLYDLHD